MKENVKETVRQVLDHYLQQTNRRKTPERYAVLDTVYSFKGHFTIDELGQRMEAERSFPVSRATLYNTLDLLIQLHLVAAHYFRRQVCYTAAYSRGGQFHQICTLCGKMTEIRSATLAKAVDELPLKRFRKDGSTLYIYGVCSSCQAKLTKEKNKRQKIKKQTE